jgi:hypothetical protein
MLAIFLGAETFDAVDDFGQVKKPSCSPGDWLGQAMNMVRQNDRGINYPFACVPKSYRFQGNGALFFIEKHTIFAPPGDEIHPAGLLPMGQISLSDLKSLHRLEAGATRLFPAIFCHFSMGAPSVNPKIKETI